MLLTVSTVPFKCLGSVFYFYLILSVSKDALNWSKSFYNFTIIFLK